MKILYKAIRYNKKKNEKIITERSIKVKIIYIAESTLKNDGTSIRFQN